MKINISLSEDHVYPNYGNKGDSRHDWLKKVEDKHGKGLYDYTETAYFKASKKLSYKCPIHGEVIQTASNHRQGNGCPKCGMDRIRAARHAVMLQHRDTFKDRSIKVHGPKYNYDKVDYQDSKIPVTITCPQHGDFEQTPNNHLRGKGCPKCGHTQQGHATKNKKAAEFEEKARKVHGAKYGYSKVDYQGAKIPVTITCPQHGDFKQMPNSHLSGSGCQTCAILRRSKKS